MSQGDSLRPVLFTIFYLEHDLQEIMLEVKSLYGNEMMQAATVAYNNDVDFIGLESASISKIQEIVLNIN